MPSTPERCFRVFRQTTGALYAGMTPIESAKAIRGSLPDLLMILMLQRALSNFESISQLARHGRFQEAMILGRPLFEESVLLQSVVGKSEDKRNARIVWHQHASWTGWSDTLRNLSPEELHRRNPSELLDEAQRELEVLEAYCADQGYTRMPSDLDYRTTAIELGRGRECAGYDISRQLLHAPGVALAGRLKHVGDAKMSVSLRNDTSVALLPLLTYWSTSSMMHSFVAVATVLGWQVPEQIEGLFDYLERMKLFD